MRLHGKAAVITAPDQVRDDTFHIALPVARPAVDLFDRAVFQHFAVCIFDVNVSDELTHIGIELPAALKLVGFRSEAAEVEGRVAGVENQLEVVGIDVVQQAQGVMPGLPAVIHAVFMPVDDAFAFTDAHQFPDLRENDFLKIGIVESLLRCALETHAANHFDAEFVHARNGGEKFFSARFEIRIGTRRFAPVGNIAPVTVETDIGMGKNLENLFELRVTDRAEIFRADESGLNEFPSEFLRRPDLLFQIAGRLICESCQKHDNVSLSGFPVTI